jgi:hypothetical protein
VFCGGEGIFRFSMADEEHDLAGRGILGGSNRLVDAVMLKRA